MDRQQKSQGFRSIQNRILFFSILVTLVPSFGMGWFWFDMTRKATTEKIEQKLVDSAGIAEREINLWFKERNYELRVFANSLVLLDNLRQYRVVRGDKAAKQQRLAAAYLRKISSYLTLIRNEFTEYRRLLVLDNVGQIIAASDTPDRDRPIVLPGDWQDQIAKSQFFTGDVSFIDDDLSPLILIGIPLISEQNSSQLGFFAMEVRLQALLPLLTASLPKKDQGTGASSIILLRKDGRYILSTASPKNDKEEVAASAQVLQLIQQPRRLQEFVNDRKVRDIGLAISIDDLPWSLVVAENYDEVFAGLLQARNQIVLITILLTIIIGGAATIVASQIIIPLNALTDGVLRVADGDLAVSVHIHRNDELGIVAGIFNEMVGRLKEDQAKLEQLATIDSLTGLAIRKHIMAELAEHIQLYRRYATEFSILMIDIDHFKSINDSYGHLTGDAVLVQLAQVFRETLRTMDRAGRYGGEEFLVILAKTDIRKALQTAERIRLAVEQHIFTYEDVSPRVTISVGVAGMTAEDDNDVSLIGRADKALYEAKADGRNRVVLRSVSAPDSSPLGQEGPEWFPAIWPVRGRGESIR